MMAALSTEARLAAQKRITGLLCDVREPIAVTRPQLAAAIAALDDFLEANAAAINSAIPAASRSALTTKQKAMILAYVALQRYGVI